jgi:hypothetical protein
MQAAWGGLVADKKIGLTMDKQDMNAERLAAALRAVESPDIRERASTLGALARTEGGEKQAADEIERRLWEATKGISIHPAPAVTEKEPLDISRAYAAHRPPVESPKREKISDDQLEPEVAEEKD